MPRGVPSITSNYEVKKELRAQTSAAEELTEAPKPELLGTINIQTPTDPFAGRPPWEIDTNSPLKPGDPRRFIECPKDWRLVWLSPRKIAIDGVRNYEPVKAYDSRVKVKVPAVVDTSHLIRWGGHQDGMILYYMPMSWWESRLREKTKKARRVTQSAVDRHRDVSERIKQGEFGRYVSAPSGQHPTHTAGEGRTMEKD